MSATSIPVLIIRAEPGASETAMRVEALGLSAIVSPVLSMRVRVDTVLPAPNAISGLIFTSANGVRAYSARSNDRALRAWCVGPATANAARVAGFAQVSESAGDAVALAQFIANNSNPTTAPLLHVANIAAKGDLKRQLEAQGFVVDFAPLYEMCPAEALSPEADQILAQMELGIVLVHSAMGATRFSQLVADRSACNLIAAAISAPAATPLSALNLKAISIAEAPNEAALIDALQSAIATLSA